MTNTVRNFCITAAVLAAYSQEHGMVHGALVTAAADTAAVWLFHPDLAPGQAMASVEFKINFLAPATLSGGPLRAAARLVKRGKRLGIAASDVFQGEVLVACGLFTYMFFEPPRRA